MCARMRLASLWVFYDFLTSSSSNEGDVAGLDLTARDAARHQLQVPQELAFAMKFEQARPSGGHKQHDQCRAACDRGEDTHGAKNERDQCQHAELWKKLASHVTQSLQLRELSEDRGELLRGDIGGIK